MVEWLSRVQKGVLERKSYKVLVCGFCFIAGIIIHSFLDFKINFFWLYNLFLVLAVALILFWKDKKTRLILLGAFFVMLGFARFNLGIAENPSSRAELTTGHGKILPGYWGKEIEIAGTIVDEPINKIDKQQLVIRPQTINGQNFAGRERILITANLYPNYFYGGKLRFFCKLQEPKRFSDFDYARYLSMQNIHGLCYWPDISVITASSFVIPAKAGIQAEFSGSRIPSSRSWRFTTGHGKSGMTQVLMSGMTKILNFKNFLIGKINIFFHEPAASFISGLIIGARNSIPPKLLENFSRTGTTHIIAISGWNISFLGTIFLPCLFVFRIKRGQAFYVMLVLIFLYAFLAGMGASVLRAAIMGVIALWAKKTGRLNNAGRALLYGIALMFLINPRVIYDVGFWLSVSATFGLIYFSPAAEGLFELSKIKFKIMRENLGATISAVIFTLPISFYVFGGASLWALPANILILPFIAVVIGLSLAVLPVAIFIPALANWLFLPSAAILNFIIGVVNFFAAIPFGYFPIRINFWIMLAAYTGIIYFTFYKLKELKDDI